MTTPTAPPPCPRQTWYAVLCSSDVTSRPLGFQFLEQELLAFRDEAGTPHVLAARCAHRACSLALGWRSGEHLVCPYHGWQYDTSGRCRHIPAEPDHPPPAAARVASYPVREHYGLLWMWHGDPDHPGLRVPPPTLPQLDALQIRPDADEDWLYDTHFTRTLENAIDPTHAPFVHGASIGRRDPDVDLTLPSYSCVLSDDTIYGRMPIKLQKISGLARLVLKASPDTIYKEYWYVYPNLVVSLVTFGRVTLAALQAFVPEGPLRTRSRLVNARNMLLSTPLLSSWFDRVTSRTGQTISREDQAVLETQRPRYVTLRGSGEMLVGSDRILTELRRLLARRLDAEASEGH
ncbi:aromatic ring-hydroxylating dioxygenase subunit alpha [Synechococcus sp. RSCCF101]|uniref:aromatic ring-hydroxylating oxygenase subunit alpha n=1 Tax=Synechococcus sp. RSCCF101 TaxID=2511069 RepID=UPI001244698B|nr:aromatic ring-hydroxylating dioxygenase subunit alpha [Synechococcus sp. RSCCF101]QEY32507.1 aromatic ring-hydroxylating dioxygenase subunit alpha [Synechococcus sp. RSCCF101]